MEDRDMDPQEAHWRSVAKPMPRERALLPYRDEFTEEDGENILRCVLPHQMEDKWIVLHNDATLDFHRSWTGFHIYSVVLRPYETPFGQSHSGPIETWVNRNPEQWDSTNEALEVARVRWLLRTLVLDQDVPFPENPAATGDDALFDAWAFGGKSVAWLPEWDADKSSPAEDDSDDPPPYYRV